MKHDETRRSDKLYIIRNGAKEYNLSVLLSEWTSFVSQCEQGYQFDISEYDNDVSIRDKIEEVINNEELYSPQDVQRFADAVHMLDEQLRALFIDNVYRPFTSGTWWEASILKFAGQEYSEDMLNLYKIDVVNIR